MKLQQNAANQADEWFDRVAKSLNLPDSQYEAAERSYKSVASWLERKESEFKDVDVKVYTQGSFRLGTAIQPFDREDEYDLDIICEFDLSKKAQTQQALHATLGRELVAYAERYGMDRPDGWDRCWTLNYADSARFHMDVLPCVPDVLYQRHLRETSSASLSYVEGSVAITDRQHKNFRVLSNEWPASNPNGFATWFYDRMRSAFNQRREQMRLVEAKADVADIPEFRVRTPLQLAIQILKRHRDVYFSTRDATLRPSSILITTLAAQAYTQQSTVLSALSTILEQVTRIAPMQNRYYVPNPSDPRENFADAWNDDPKKAQVFLAWAKQAHADFTAARSQVTTSSFIASLSQKLGRSIVESALKDASIKPIGSGWKFWRLEHAKHRLAPSWPVSTSGRVTLSATYRRDGFRTHQLENNGSELPLGCDLTFTASTIDIPSPFEVYWQVVNTGVAATDAGQLRGKFEAPKVRDGYLVRKENTLYPGIHSIECFIVKNGFVAARSGIFVVNVGTDSF